MAPQQLRWPRCRSNDQGLVLHALIRLHIPAHTHTHVLRAKRLSPGAGSGRGPRGCEVRRRGQSAQQKPPGLTQRPSGGPRRGPRQGVSGASQAAGPGGRRGGGAGQCRGESPGAAMATPTGPQGGGPHGAVERGRSTFGVAGCERRTGAFYVRGGGVRAYNGGALRLGVAGCKRRTGAFCVRGGWVRV